MLSTQKKLARENVTEIHTENTVGHKSRNEATKWVSLGYKVSKDNFAYT